VAPVQQRTAYMEALEQASAFQDIGPFTDLAALVGGRGPAARPVKRPLKSRGPHLGET